jgi:RimJ/RimL family protein N-acetyltransferase
MRRYKFFKNQEFQSNGFEIVPIRDEDKYLIMDMRNEQLYHLRQQNQLTREQQENYFEKVVTNLFEQDKPNQILFSFLQEGICIGYGGLVHINWIDRHAEISFIIKPCLEKELFTISWQNFLLMIEKVAFEEIDLHKVFTYAFDMRPHLYLVVESCGFYKEAILKEHCFFNDKFIDVVIHSKLNAKH